MVQPGEIGRAELEIEFDADPLSAQREVREALAGTDAEMRATGDRWGHELSRGMGDRLEREAPLLGRRLQDGFDRSSVTQHLKVKTDVDVDNDAAGRIIRNIVGDLERAVTSGGGDAFAAVGKTIGSTVADGIGAGFNVSGKSPLILLLVPVIGGIAALFAAAAEAAYGFAGALLTIPTLLSAILVEGGVLFLIFKNISEAASAAFAIDNPVKFERYLRTLNPVLAEFIRQLAEWKEFFRQLGANATIAFLTQFGQTLRDIGKAVGPQLLQGLTAVGAALGKWFAIIGKAFESKAFIDFMNNLFSSIENFLSHNGPAFEKFLEAVFRFLDFMIAPANEIGGLFNALLVTFGEFLVELTHSKGFQDFLDQLPLLLVEGAQALGLLLKLFLTLFQAFDAAGGQKFLEKFIIVLLILIAIFDSDVGVDSFKALIVILEFGLFMFLGLIVAITGFLAFLARLAQWGKDAYHALLDFFNWLTWKIIMIGIDIENWWNGLMGKFLAWSPIAFVIEWWDRIQRWLTETLPQNLAKAWNWVNNWFKTKGEEAAKNFIYGFLGIYEGKLNKEKFAQQFGKVLEGVDDFTPHSPAKKGVFSGAGAPALRGKAIIEGLAKGMTDGIPMIDRATNNAMSAFNFQPGAINANFYGSNPTPQQAHQLGMGLGNGLSDQLAARNTELAVRSM